MENNEGMTRIDMIRDHDDVVRVLYSHEREIKLLRAKLAQQELDDAPTKWVTGKLVGGLGAALTAAGTAAYLKYFN